MKIRRKNPVLEFDPVSTDCETPKTYEVIQGSQILGHVTYEEGGGNLFITDLFVNPEFTAFGVETQILDALLASDEVHTVTLVVPLSAVSHYEGAGFECDPKQILLSKNKK